MHASPRLTSSVVVVLLFLSLALLGGCDTHVDPLVDEAGRYSIYGGLNIRDDHNVIRVRNLNTPITRDSTDEIDVDVTLTNHSSGTTETLRDSVVEFEGVFTHNFVSEMDIQPNTEYEVTLHPNRGRPVATTATTPHIAEYNVSPKNEDCRTLITMSFQPVKAPKYLEVSLGVYYEDELHMSSSVVRPWRSGTDSSKVEVRITPLDLLDHFFKDEPFNSGEYDHPVWCHELDRDVLRVEFNHYGPDFFSHPPSDSLNLPGGRVGRFGGFYDESFEFKIDTVNICKPFC